MTQVGIFLCYSSHILGGPCLGLALKSIYSWGSGQCQDFTVGQVIDHASMSEVPGW